VTTPKHVPAAKFLDSIAIEFGVEFQNSIAASFFFFFFWIPYTHFSIIGVPLAFLYSYIWVLLLIIQKIISTHLPYSRKYIILLIRKVHKFIALLADGAVHYMFCCCQNCLDQNEHRSKSGILMSWAPPRFSPILVDDCLQVDIWQLKTWLYSSWRIN